MKKAAKNSSNLDEKRLFTANIIAMTGGCLMVAGALFPRPFAEFWIQWLSFFEWYYPEELLVFGLVISALAVAALKKKKDLSLVYGICAVIGAGYIYYIHTITVVEMFSGPLGYYRGIMDTITVLGGLGALLVFSAGFMTKKKSTLTLKRRLLISRLVFLGFFVLGVIVLQSLYFDWRMMEVTPDIFHKRAKIIERNDEWISGYLSTYHEMFLVKTGTGDFMNYLEGIGENSPTVWASMVGEESWLAGVYRSMPWKAVL